MGRPKTYNADEIATKAMELFWMYGFEATSTQALVEHMGVNRYSLYAEFGTKQGLYEAALAIYEKEVVAYYLQALETATAGIEEIKTVIERFANAATDPQSERGCFLCNSATERSAHDEATRKVFTNYTDRISAAFSNALGNAHARGEIKANINLAEEGSYFAATMLGFFVLLRSCAGDKIIKPATQGALRHLTELQIS